MAANPAALEYQIGTLSVGPQGVTILQANPANPSVQAGSSFNLTYNWQGGPTVAPLWAFVHFVNSSGAAVLWDDHQPPTPTNLWSGAVSYTRTISVPGTISSGTYQIIAGLFDLSSGQRLGLTAGPGVTANTTALEYQIGTLTVNTAQPSGAGLVHLWKVSNKYFDTYLTNRTPATQQWMKTHYDWFLMYTPMWDGWLSWAPPGAVYKDSYAIYRSDSVTVSQHPEWILRDAYGNWLYIQFECNGTYCTQYAADISNPAFQQWWVNQARPLIGTVGYAGLFIDDVNLDWRISNGRGELVNPIDPNTRSAMALADWRRYFAGFMQVVRSAFPSTVLVHNSIWWTEAAGLNARDPSVQSQVQAGDIQYIEFGVNDGGISGGTGTWSLRTLLGYVENLNAMGKRAVFANFANSAYQTARDFGAAEYAEACYFLVSNGKNMLGDAGLFTAPDLWWAGLDVNLGGPTSARYDWNGLMRRDFQNGMVLVNEPGAGSVSTPLPQTFRTIYGVSVTSVTMGARQGIVLLK